MMNTNTLKPEIEIVELGRIHVDTATMMMVDPMYVYDPEWVDQIGDQLRGLEFGRCISLNNSSVVMIRTGFGDGSYRVTLEIVDCGKRGKRVKSSTITFIEDEELEQHLN